MDSQDNILRDVINDGPAGGAEDADLALAKLLQDQERAFFHARGMYADEENGADFAGLAHPHGGGSSSEGGGLGESGGEGESAEELGLAEAGDGGAEGPIDDAELARRLHLQEELDLHRRLMELAGIHAEGEEEFTDEDEEGYLTDDSVDPDDMTYEELRALGDAVGVVSRGASVEVIKALPLARYPAVAAAAAAAAAAAGADVGGAGAAAAGQEEQCVVCRMEFERGEDVKLLPCGHCFHPDCVDQWLLINKVCPICSKEVTAAGSRASDTDSGPAPSKPSKA